jgi:Tfp pilus assembly protein PilE
MVARPSRSLLSAIAIPAFTRYIKRAKTAEAAEQLTRCGPGR